MKKKYLINSSDFIFVLAFGILGATFFFIGMITLFFTMEWFLLIFIVVGLVFSIVAAAFFGKYRKNIEKKNRLLAANQFLEAEIVEIQPNWNMQINNQPTYKLLARYFTEDGTPYIYTSDLIRENPAISLTKNFVKVYYNPEDPSEYYVDVESAMNTPVYI